MARCSRRQIVRPRVPGIFHCFSRCVRQAFLMGIDAASGRDYNHRRDWVTQRLQLLVSCFAIDVAFVATMSNHLHLVLRTYPRMVQCMGNQEVARRWLRVYPGKRVLDGHWIEPTDVQVEALAADEKKIKKIRKRLSDISWFLGALCEYIGRRSNLEDETSGRFWQGRFGCREISGENALLVCGLYVDLNQIRAGEAFAPEQCDCSSVGYRLRGLLGTEDVEQPIDGWLAPFTLREGDFELGEAPSVTGLRASDRGILPMSFEEYLKLLDWAGRQARGDASGVIPDELAPILDRLAIKHEGLGDSVLQFAGRFKRFVGSAKQFADRAAEAGRRWLQGASAAAQVFR